MKAATLTGAYAEAGYVRKNLQWSWSARRSDPPGVALTVWDHQIDRSQEPWFLDPETFRDISIWRERLGNRERIENIRFGLDHCGGRFDLIWICALDPMAEPKRVAERAWMRERVGLISTDDFDPSSGAFKMRIARR